MSDGGTAAKPCLSIGLPVYNGEAYLDAALESLLSQDFRDFELIVCDASFISLALLLPQWPALLAPGGHVLALVKPQFEVGREGVGKGGIVREPARYAEVEARLRAAAAACGIHVLDWFDSPITGSDGNREFFFHGVPATAPAAPTHPDTA